MSVWANMKSNILNNYLQKAKNSFQLAAFIYVLIYASIFFRPIKLNYQSSNSIKKVLNQ